MHNLRIAAGLLIGAALAVPLIAFAITPGVTTGGRIVTIHPCLNGTLFMTVFNELNVGYGAVLPYIYIPGTPTVYAGPPRNPGQEIAGFASPTPLPLCVMSYVPFIALPGFPFTFMVGTSIY